jgi:hypothetical protein
LDVPGKLLERLLCIVGFILTWSCSIIFLSGRVAV